MAAEYVYLNVSKFNQVSTPDTLVRLVGVCLLVGMFAIAVVVWFWRSRGHDSLADFVWTLGFFVAAGTVLLLSIAEHAYSGIQVAPDVNHYVYVELNDLVPDYQESDLLDEYDREHLDFVKVCSDPLQVETLVETATSQGLFPNLPPVEMRNQFGFSLYTWCRLNGGA